MDSSNEYNEVVQDGRRETNILENNNLCGMSLAGKGKVAGKDTGKGLARDLLVTSQRPNQWLSQHPSNCRTKPWLQRKFLSS